MRNSFQNRHPAQSNEKNYYDLINCIKLYDYKLQNKNLHHNSKVDKTKENSVPN